MASLKFLAILGLIALVGARAADFEEEDDVIVLTDDNFDDVVKENDMLLVEFYAPWCGHCKNLAPEYAKAAKALKEQDPPIRIAKVDATAHNKVSEKYGVQGFPTLKLFKGSVEKEDAKEYDGGRTADDIQKWMIKKAGPAVKIVGNKEELNAIIEKNEVVVVGVLDSVDGEHKLLLEKVADKEDSSVFVAIANSEIADDYKPAPSVTVHKKFDEGKVHHEGDFEVDAIHKFVKEHNKPLVMTFSQDKASQIFGGDIDVHLLMFADESKDYYKPLTEAAKVAAKENKGKLLHIVIPLSEDRILDYFNFKEADLPAVMLVNMAAGMKKYAFDKKADDLKAVLETSFGDELLAFEKKYFDGSLKPTLKSAEPADDADEAVKVIVGKDFKERVVDSDKDVLLEFYAPWCGHCKSLAPKYEELAEKFSGVDSIMIAKMDATENEVDHPGVDVQGFPTLIFFPAKDKQNPVSYDGDRDVKGMTEFLKKHSQKFELDGESHGKDHDEL